MTEESDLEKTVEFFRFLQGDVPDGYYRIAEGHMPTLTPDQAWTVVWYLGNRYWQVKDYIERCGTCGDLYDSHCSGEFREAEDVVPGAPHGFRCDGCRDDFLETERKDYEP